jgi:hypothetical protein
MFYLQKTRVVDIADVQKWSSNYVFIERDDPSVAQICPYAASAYGALSFSMTATTLWHIIFLCTTPNIKNAWVPPWGRHVQGVGTWGLLSQGLGQACY